MTQDPTTRFSDRVQNYIQFRPNYPKEAIKFVINQCGLNHESVIADIGSGTGILTKSWLENGFQCFGVEPNKEMREAGEQFLKNFSHFKSINGHAEATTLLSNTVDLISAGQAFHWFDVQKTQREFLRIMKPQGIIALIWNSRRQDTLFLQEYEKLIQKYSAYYLKVQHQSDKVLNGINIFFGSDNKYKLKKFNNEQYFDLKGLKGRLLSSSYSPTENHPNYPPFLNALKLLFNRFQENGKIVIKYDTEIFIGSLR